jgi:hypothetical protein
LKIGLLVWSGSKTCRLEIGLFSLKPI